MFDLIKKLSETNGVSGFEDPVRKYIKKEISQYVDELRVDSIGNIIGIKKGEGKSKKSVAITAHMDEIGLIVKYITQEGFIRFTKMGGIDDRYLLSKYVKIYNSKNNNIPGIICGPPWFIQDEKAREKKYKHSELFIDVGVSSKEEVRKLGIDIGDPIAFEVKSKDFNNFISGKAFDDRLGCAIIMESLKKLETCPIDVKAIFTSQEELGLRGGIVAGYSSNPDWAIAIDTPAAGDVLNVKEFELPLKLDKGPSITIADGGRETLGGGLISNPKLRKYIINVAEENKIPYQLEIGTGGTSDATAIQLSRGGIPSIMIGPPIRYIHNPIGLASKKDIKNTVSLLINSLQDLHRGLIK